MKFSQYLLLTLKGCAMGMADVVPGVSGGTIAFISGIYEELIESIKSVDATALRLLGTLRLKEFWRHINGRFLLSLPCLLGYNLWSNFRPIAGRDVLDSEDFLVSNLLLPLGSLLFIIFCTTRYGWGWENFLAEANEGKGLKIAKWLRPYMTYVLPVIVGIILIFGLYNFFAA